MENARLREEHPEVSERVEREAGLGREVEKLSERAREGERWAEESAEAAKRAEQRAVEAEGRVRDLQRLLEAEQSALAEARRDHGSMGPEAGKVRVLYKNARRC